MATLEESALIAHLKAKWGERACPMCSAVDWSVGDRVFQLAEFHKGNVIIGGPVVPVIPVTCGNCGNTVLVNALLSGMLEAPVVVDKESSGATAK